MQAKRSDAPVVTRPVLTAERTRLKIDGIQWYAVPEREHALWITPKGIVCLGRALYGRMGAPSQVQFGWDPTTHCMVVNATPESGITISHTRKSGTVEMERGDLVRWLTGLHLTGIDPIAPKWDVADPDVAGTLWFFSVGDRTVTA